MDVSDVMAAIAERLRALPDVTVYYPAPNAIAASPAIVVMDGNSEGPSVYERTFSGQEVGARITVRILVKSHRDRPREATRIDRLVPQVLDALDPAGTGVANDLLPGLPDHLDRIWDRATVVRGSTEEYAGEYCYAADIGLDPLFTRTPQEIV